MVRKLEKLEFALGFNSFHINVPHQEKIIVKSSIFEKCVKSWGGESRLTLFKRNEFAKGKQPWAEIFGPLMKNAVGFNVQPQGHRSITDKERLYFHCKEHKAGFFSLTALSNAIQQGKDVEWEIVPPKEHCECSKSKIIIESLTLVRQIFKLQFLFYFLINSKERFRNRTIMFHFEDYQLFFLNHNFLRLNNTQLKHNKLSKIEPNFGQA